MLSFVESVLFGIVQGLTEWLPISSSGHLVMLQNLLDWNPPLLFHILLHVGTVLVVTAFFRRDIAGILRAFVGRDFTSTEGRLGAFVVVGSVPTAAIGYVFNDLFASIFDNLLIVGLGLLVTGVLLFVSQRREGEKTLSYLDVLLVGTMQGLAIIPGVSRSGVTISTGLLHGLDRDVAFRFSFLLSVPAVLGAAVMESGDFSMLMGEADIVTVLLGVVVSMVVGYFSLRLLRSLLVRRKLHWFTPYCWVVGILLLVSQLT
jgi:undecaprenyl-diphosphatase